MEPETDIVAEQGPEVEEHKIVVVEERRSLLKFKCF
jgi:hypothetical protein